MKITQTIQRRKTEPLLANACHVINHYGKATDCLTTIIDTDYNAIETSQDANAMFFCSVCKHYRNLLSGCSLENSGAGTDSAVSDFPCFRKHISAVNDSCRMGGSIIYHCDLGFLFWTSPFFTGEQFAGAAIGSGVLGVSQRQAVEKIQEISGGEISDSQIKQHLDKFTEKNQEDVKAMAQMMLICADQLSLKNLNNEILFSEENEQLSGILADTNESKDSDNEIKLLASLRRGDREEARNILEELLARYKSGNDFEALQLRVIELAALFSRAAAHSKNPDISGILEENDKYLRKIEETDNADELSEILGMIMNLMAGKMFSFHGVLHSSALRKAERFIQRNFTHKISLKEIASAAGLSAPYFSTIFREEMGIHLSHYLNRLRVAKAAARLTDTNQSISKIATSCGFQDQSWFSKIFKGHTGISPGKYREQGGIFGIQEWMSHKDMFSDIAI